MSVASAPVSAALPPLPFGVPWHCGGCGNVIGIARGRTLTIAYHHRMTTITAPAQVAQKCRCGYVNHWPTT